MFNFGCFPVMIHCISLEAYPRAKQLLIPRLEVDGGGEGVIGTASLVRP